MVPKKCSRTDAERQTDSLTDRHTRRQRNTHYRVKSLQQNLDVKFVDNLNAEDWLLRQVYVDRAVTVGCEMNLSLKTPCEVFEANAGFKREVTVNNSQV